jgi:hypothetical protein
MEKVLTIEVKSESQDQGSDTMGEKAIPDRQSARSL